MTDKEKMKYYLDLLKDWEKCLAAFFENECPDAPPGAVRSLLEGHKAITETMAGIVDNLPNE